MVRRCHWRCSPAVDVLVCWLPGYHTNKWPAFFLALSPIAVSCASPLTSHLPALFHLFERVGGRNCVYPSLRNPGLEVLCLVQAMLQRALSSHRVLTAFGHCWLGLNSARWPRRKRPRILLLNPSAILSLVYNYLRHMGWSGVWGVLVSYVCLGKFSHCSN